MRKKIFENNYGIEFIPKKNKLSCDGIYNYKCFDENNNYILMYIKYEEKISDINFFYEDFHNIRFHWEKINYDISKINYIDENTKFILNWSLNTLDHLANKEYYELAQIELVCYYILGNTLNKIKYSDNNNGNNNNENNNNGNNNNEYNNNENNNENNNNENNNNENNNNNE